MVSSWFYRKPIIFSNVFASSSLLFPFCRTYFFHSSIFALVFVTYVFLMLIISLTLCAFLLCHHPQSLINNVFVHSFSLAMIFVTAMFNICLSSFRICRCIFVSLSFAFWLTNHHCSDKQVSTNLCSFKTINSSQIISSNDSTPLSYRGLLVCVGCGE